MKSNLIKIGDVFDTKEGGSVIVVNYENSKNITVRHMDDCGYTTTVASTNLRNGAVKNPYKPSVYGVGFLGVGKYKAKVGGESIKSYSIWQQMIGRCYTDKRNVKNNRYADCTVCPDWHNYQCFAEWYNNHEFCDKGYHLDKDLLVVGNRVYSPDKCLLVPAEINALTMTRKSLRGDYPIGVHYDSSRGKFMSNMQVEGKTRNLGRYSCPQVAHQVYVTAKEAHMKNMAEKYQDKIDDKTYEALMNWKVEYE